MSTTMKWSDAIDSYIRDQWQYGRINSKQTERCSRRVLRLHAQDTPAGPLRAARGDVKQTLARWEHPNTRAREHTVLVSFYDWMLTEGHRPDNPARQVRRPKMRKPAVRRLTRAEVDAMIAACETQRERWVILLGVCTGARASELTGCQGRHFARRGFVWFSEDIAKGKRERWVPVLPELEPVVEEIRATIRHDHYVVATYKTCSGVQQPRTCRISACTVGRLIGAIAKRAGIARHVHPHLLRHAFGTHVARHAGLRVAQALMGHASVETTARVYTDCPDLDELAATVQGLRYGAEGSRGEALSGDAEAVSLVEEFAQLADRARAAGLDLATLTGGDA
jgi:site-specific recombinase XerD